MEDSRPRPCYNTEADQSPYTEADQDRAFILAYRIMGKITETNGDTDWLKDGAPHCNVRRDYYDTDRGIKKLTDVVDVGEDDTAASQSH